MPKKKLGRKVKRVTEEMGKAAGWKTTLRCTRCGHVYNPLKKKRHVCKNR